MQLSLKSNFINTSSNKLKIPLFLGEYLATVNITTAVEVCRVLELLCWVLKQLENLESVNSKLFAVYFTLYRPVRRGLSFQVYIRQRTLLINPLSTNLLDGQTNLFLGYSIFKALLCCPVQRALELFFTLKLPLLKITFFDINFWKV